MSNAPITTTHARELVLKAMRAHIQATLDYSRPRTFDLSAGPTEHLDFDNVPECIAFKQSHRKTVVCRTFKASGALFLLDPNNTQCNAAEGTP